MKTPVKHWEEILRVLENNIGGKFHMLDIQYDASVCQYCNNYDSCKNCPLDKYGFNCACGGPYNYFLNNRKTIVNKYIINAAWYMYSVLYFIEQSEKE